MIISRHASYCKSSAGRNGVSRSESQRREKMAEVGEKVRKIRADADRQAIELLTAEQKESLEKRKGDKFEL